MERFTSKSAIWSVFWLYLLILFSAADIITTRICTDSGFAELNPFLAGCLDRLLEIKVVFIVSMIILTYCAEKIYSSKWFSFKETNDGRIAESLFRNSGWCIPASASCMTFGCVLNNLLLLL